MNSLKKLAILMFIFLTGILCFTTVVKADSDDPRTKSTEKYTEETVNIKTIEELYRNMNLFCLVKDAKQPKGEYKRFAHINIDGNVAKYGDKTWTNSENAKLAYMLNQKKITYTYNNQLKERDVKIIDYNPNYGYIADRLSVQRAMGWLFFPNWFKSATAKNALDINTDDFTIQGWTIKELEKENSEWPDKYPAGELTAAYNKFLEDANTYANNYQINTLETIQTNDSIGIKEVKIGNVEYYQVGPFKCKFSNKLESITVNDGNVDFEPSMYTQKQKNFTNVSEIESDINFYINIKADRLVENIKKVKIVGQEVTIYGADIYLYKYNGNEGLDRQNFAYYEVSEDSKKPFVEYELNLPVDAKLIIQKEDKSLSGENVLGVKFKVYSHIRKQWLILEKKNGEYKINGYTLKFDEATEIPTEKKVKKDNKIYGVTLPVTGMPVGEYTIYETELPEEYKYLYSLGTSSVPDGGNNFKIETSTKEAKVVFDKQKVKAGVCTVTAINTPTLGSLKITKIDTVSEKPVDGIGFKIYSKVKNNREDKTGWLVIDEKTWELKGYTTFDEATEITTKTIGKTKGITETIKKLPAGEYEVYETNIGNYKELYVLNEIEIVEGKEGTNKIIRKAKKIETAKVDATGITKTTTTKAGNTPELGSLQILKLDENDNPLNAIGFKIYSINREGWLNVNTSGKLLGYVRTIDEVTDNIYTGSNGYTPVIDKLPAGEYVIYETKVGKYSDKYELKETNVPGGTKEKVKNIEKVTVTPTGTEVVTKHTIKNMPDFGSLVIKKIDKNSEKALPGIGFKVYSQINNQKGWLKLNDDNEVVEYTTFDKATELYTNENGFTDEIRKLPAGNYDVYETSLKHGNYDYSEIYAIEENDSVPEGPSGTLTKRVAKLVETTEVKVNEKSESTKCIAENERVYINLSGYVWLDRQSQKQSIRNDLFKEDENDNADIALKGIKVGLYSRFYTGLWIPGQEHSGPHDFLIQETETDENGAYSFKNVKISDLGHLVVKFEYDGLTYTNVDPILSEAKGSKVAEFSGDREKFNKKFEIIENGTEIDGKELEYYTQDHKSTLMNKSRFVINADNERAEFYLHSQYENGNFEYNEDGTAEIKNINLGLYEREQPDLAVVKDIENAKVSVNGYDHMYKYGSRFLNEGDYKDGFNVGVKFGEKYGKQTYSRAIYKTDYNYHNENDKNKELKVYITYKIGIKNQATSLTSRVNSLVDYYDSRYTLEGIGRSIDDTTGEILKTDSRMDYRDTKYNDEYKKLEIFTKMNVDSQKDQYIYVQFSLSKEAISTIFFDANGKEIEDKLLLDNVVEITSYSTFKDDAIYAGIDKDSQPGNAVPGDVNTYEDDTDKAPALQILGAEARKITGTVFLDKTSDELKVGQERKGNGIYDEGIEKTISEVEVKMLNENGDVVATDKTDENGYFELSGFAPGNYTIIYTWGDTTYNVHDYKGTIYNDEARMTNNKWYQQSEIRYSDATDNYNRRVDIDSGKHPEYTTMVSETPLMSFGIELSDTVSEGLMGITSGIDGVKFEVKNVDFGIVERPRQKLDISKHATAMKITLANNMGTLDAIIDRDENGNIILKGTGLEMLTATPQEGTRKGALLLAQVDSDILQGAKIQVEYTISVANNSELDYDSERYYKFGEISGNKITIKPEGVYDYLEGSVLDSEKATENSGWVEKSRTEYNNETSNTTIMDQYLIGHSSSIVSPDGTITNISGYEEFIAEHYEKITEYTVELVKELRETLLADKTILRNANLEKTLEPGQSNTAKLYTSKELSVADEIDLNNSAEITKVQKNTNAGRTITPRDSSLYTFAEEITVTPPTGDNHNYVLPIILGVSTFIILGAGVVLIKKKVLNK